MTRPEAWQTGPVQDALGLTPEEAVYVDIKAALHIRLKRERLALGLTQRQLAERLGSSQSRVAKMEGGDPGVTLDLLVRALLQLGVTRGQLATLFR